MGEETEENLEEEMKKLQDNSSRRKLDEEFPPCWGFQSICKDLKDLGAMQAFDPSVLICYQNLESIALLWKNVTFQLTLAISRQKEMILAYGNGYLLFQLKWGSLE